jgi:hypothetical protein
MRTPLLIVILSLFISPSVGLAAEVELAAEAADDSTTEVVHKLRQFSVYLGGSFAFGGGGLGFELLSRSGRYAIVGGYGSQFLNFDGLVDEAVAIRSWGIGAKRYFDGGKHRFFAQSAFGPSAWGGFLSGTRDDPEFDVENTYYGNSLGLGYRYTSYRGFTYFTDFDEVWTHVGGKIQYYWGMGLGWSW